MGKTGTRHRNLMFRLVVLAALTFAGVCASLMVGRYPITLGDLVRALLGQPVERQISQIMYQVRLPRIFAALLVGGGLSISGAAYQGMFKNPLVSPDLLGSSAGAGLGAALAILFSFPMAAVKSTAFVFGLAAVLFTWLLGTKLGRGSKTSFLLILAGILVGSLFQSLLSLVRYAADTEQKLPEITFWLMGSLTKAGYVDVLVMAFPFAVSAGALIILSGQINILSLGEEEAHTLGVNTKLLQALIVTAATVLTAFSVSISGMIGWVGLVIPHLTRMILGPNFRYLIPGSFLLGGLYLLLMDDLCRSLFVVEIPLGIVTALAGVPFFIYLLMTGEKEW
ncbi:MAG: iron ABC transporter permease [Spirochaetaceae bacterium]|jgi:iron complex transport system permease protein|nr:iron ABC transporter permease [Spirochaetaceae bacterium]